MGALKQFLDATWVGDLIGLLGIALAFVFYQRSKSRAAVSFQTRGERLIGAAAILSTSVEVRFNGKLVPQLTKTTVVVWNSGNVTIDGSANVLTDPVGIYVGEDADVLSAEVDRTTRSVIQVQTSIDPTQRGHIFVNFAFLDPGDGAVLTILHTGKFRGGMMTGTIKGVPAGFAFRGSFEQRKPPRRVLGIPLPPSDWAAAAMMILGGTFFFFVGMSGWKGGTAATDAAISAALHLPKQADPGLILVGGVIFLFAGLPLWSLATKRRCPKTLAAASEAASVERP